MAEELRWETGITEVATSGNTNAFFEFRNDTSTDVFIRSIDMMLMVSDFDLTNDFSTQIQYSKSNTIDVANNTTIWQLNCIVGGSIGVATVGGGNGGGQLSVNKLYAKGQLILEPGESIFGHREQTNTVDAVKFHGTIGYHF